MTVQSTPRRSVAKQAATARRLNATRVIAQHILDTTFYDERLTSPVKRCKAGQAFCKGTVVVLPGQQFFLVQSPAFAGYCYVVACQNGQWLCSSRDEHIAQRCIRQAKNHSVQLVQAA